MIKDRVKGALTTAAAKTRQAAGKLAGKEHDAEGQAKKGSGDARNRVGGSKHAPGKDG